MDIRATEDPVGGAGEIALSERVYRQLRQSLMRAEMKPHERLKVRQIARRMGTSETPVREALFQLAHEGVVEIRPRFYIRVHRPNLREYTEICDIRMTLEPMAAERALPFIDDAFIDRQSARHEALISAEAREDWPTALQANFDFHFNLYGRSRMRTLTDMLEMLWIRVGPLFGELYPQAHPTYAERHQHLNILDALRARDAYSLRQAIRMDLLEGGRNLRQHLKKHEAITAIDGLTHRQRKSDT